jgi:hypothetical protein
LTRAEFAKLPRFQYVPEADGPVFDRIAINFVSLAGAAFAVLLIGFAYLKRYPVAAR